MDPLDLVFVLAEGRERPMHVGGLQLFTPPPDAGPDYIREIYEAAVAEQRELHPLLARRPGRTPLLGRFQWEEDKRIDLSYHVRHTGLARPGRIRELLEVVSQLHGTLLDRKRPLWEAHLIEGLDDGRFAVYTKVHHALLDGVSAMRLLSDALSVDPEERDMPSPWAARSRVRAIKAAMGDSGEGSGGSVVEQAVAGVLGGAAALARAGYDAVAVSGRLNQSIRDGLSEQAAVLPYQAPPSMFNVPITGARRFAAESWSLDRIKKVGKDNGATINDTVLAMCGGALRRYLTDFDALPDTPLVAMVPVSLRNDDSAGGNAVGVILANLGTHTPSAAERFDSVKDSMAAAKKRFQGMSQGQMLAISAFMVAPMATGPLFRFEGFRRAPFNVVISNVPGPPEPRYWNGARLDGSFPASIPTDGLALNITFCSYAGSLDFGITACRDAVPHAQRLLDYLEDSLQELEAL